MSMGFLPSTRRHFLATGAKATAAFAMVPSTVLNAVPGPEHLGKRLDAQARRSDIGALDEVRFQELALRAVDAAKRAGATYADVRITRVMALEWSAAPGESQTLATGIRALVNGYWGFASGPYWTLDEMDRLAREAVAQAKVNARGKARTVELGRIPPATGSWTMPVTTDPFSLSWEELDDFRRAWERQVLLHRFGKPIHKQLHFRRMEKTCASTEGSLFTQTTYATGGLFTLRTDQGPEAALDLSLVGAGWEYIQEANIFAQIPRLIEESQQSATISVKPVEAGRYPLVCSGSVMAALLAATFAPATQVDRALGYEANASGTSFLNKPLDMLGQMAVAAPSVTITADRTMTRGLNTTRWDDEGAATAPFPLVKDGVLAGYQTTREQAAWLAPAYQRLGQPVQSHACAHTDSALDLPMQHTPNLALHPGSDDIGLDELIASIPRGFAFLGGGIAMDFQARHGGSGRAALFREIVKGKLGAYVENAGILFDSIELWKNTAALGGAQSRWLDVGRSTKGEPGQTCLFSVNAVPAAFKEIALIDVTKRA